MWAGTHMRHLTGRGSGRAAVSLLQRAVIYLPASTSPCLTPDWKRPFLLQDSTIPHYSVWYWGHLPDSRRDLRGILLSAPHLECGGSSGVGCVQIMGLDSVWDRLHLIDCCLLLLSFESNSVASTGPAVFCSAVASNVCNIFPKRLI